MIVSGIEHWYKVIPNSRLETQVTPMATSIKLGGEDYQSLKQRLSEALIAFVDRPYPDFADIIEYQELATPVLRINPPLKP